MPDKKNKGDISTTALHRQGALVPGALTAYLADPVSDADIDARLKRWPGIPDEPPTDDIIATRDFIVERISVKAETVKDAIPELRRKYTQALIASVHECERLRALHEKNTGREVRYVKLDVGYLVKDVHLETNSNESPEEINAIVNHALHLAARDFEEMKELPAADHTNARHQNTQARLKQAIDNKPAAAHTNINPVVPAHAYGVTPTIKKTRKVANNAEIIKSTPEVTIPNNRPAVDNTGTPAAIIEAYLRKNERVKKANGRDASIIKKEIEHLSENKYNEAVKAYAKDKALEYSPKVIAEGLTHINKLAKYAVPFKALGEQVTAITTLIKAGTGKESPIAAIFPVDMVVDPVAAEFEASVFEKNLNNSYDSIKNYIDQVKDNSRNPIYEVIRRMSFIYLNDEQLKQIDEEKLDLNNSDLSYRTENSRYAILIEKQGAEITKIKQYTLSK